MVSRVVVGDLLTVSENLERRSPSRERLVGKYPDTSTRKIFCLINTVTHRIFQKEQRISELLLKG